MYEHLEIIDPRNVDGWDDLLATREDADFFHSLGWARVLCETYRFDPVYLAGMENGRLASLLPMMGVRSRLTGRRGVGLPFTDYCAPLLSDDQPLLASWDAMVDHGKRAGWRSMELRGDAGDLPGATPSCSHYRHILRLDRDSDELWAGLRDETRRNTRKAEKEGVGVTVRQDMEAVRTFARLNGLTRRAHGLPPQPFPFFRHLYEHVLSRDQGVVLLAAHRDRVVAGGVFLRWKNRAYYKYGASDPGFLHFRPNNLLMWEAIQWFADQGCDTLCLGRTESENAGLRRFKLGWGTEEQIIKYYKLDLATGSFVTGGPRISGAHNLVFRRLPMPILRGLGALLYRHMA